VTTPEQSAKESACNIAFKALKDKAVQSKLSHMFIDDEDVLIIASSNQQTPIPVVTAETGAMMIELGKDSLIAIHAGSRKLGVWLIQRCWWPSIAKEYEGTHTLLCVVSEDEVFSESGIWIPTDEMVGCARAFNLY
jgi:hypothetical protein